MKSLSLFITILICATAISCQCLTGSKTCSRKQVSKSIAPGLIYVNETTLKGPVHLANDIPIKHDGEWLNMIVEIPQGTNAKWEVDKATGELKWKIKKGIPRIVKYLPYPGHYGFIPQSLLPKDKGGDGDPLDVIAIGADAKRGATIPIRVIGVLKLLDRGDQDDKLIAVIKNGLFHKINSLKELDEKHPGITSIIKTWFANYKKPGKIKIIGYEDRDIAMNLVDTAIKSHSDTKN